MSGWYTDAALQGSWYDNVRAVSLNPSGQLLKTSGWGVAAALETGYAVALGNGFVVTPQGQLIYQRISLSGGADQFGRISFGDTDEVYGRLGARLTRNWAANNGQHFTTWVDVNLWQQFTGDAKTTFTTLQGTFPTTIASGLGGTWTQVALGLSGQVTRNVSVFGSTDYNVGLTQNGHSFGGRTGVKVVW